MIKRHEFFLKGFGDRPLVVVGELSRTNAIWSQMRIVEPNGVVGFIRSSKVVARFEGPYVPAQTAGPVGLSPTKTEGE